MGKITQEYLKSLFHYDPLSGYFTRLTTRGGNRAGGAAGTIDDDGYVRITIDGSKFRAQRLAFLYMTGAFPIGEVDHIDRVRTNNAWSNLRSATTQQNAANRAGPVRDLPKGVSPCGKKYAAAVKVNGKRIHLGVFDTPDLAHAEYINAANDHFGEYARAS